MATSSIEWTHAVWNPTTGCTKISAGCKFCYAEKMHKRLTGIGQAKYTEPFTTVIEHPSELTRTFGKSPKRIFVNSMSDLFHENVSLSFIQQVFSVIASQPQHVFQVLTKRAERLAELSPDLDWPPNLWMGVSIEDCKVCRRADYLRMCGAKVKWLSIEPLIGSVKALNLKDIDWVVVGGESGRGARPIDRFMLDMVISNCVGGGIPLFVKQFGTALAKNMGLTDAKGGNMEEWPEEYRIRQFPVTI